jgi:hypothetical protein
MRIPASAAFALLMSAWTCFGAKPNDGGPQFQTSDRCIACHNGLTTARGEDVSIGFDWRATMMANASRDPYWQGSVRRETLDHPESKALLEDECSICHMPITRYLARTRGEKGQLFSHLPFAQDKKLGKEAADGVTCSVCHQIGKEKLGTRESFVGGFVVDPPLAGGVRREYGPFLIDPGLQQIMRTSTGGYQPEQSEHIQQSEICATCHTLYTKALGPGGKEVGELPEQVPYVEWLHSGYRGKQSCQSCHMPTVEEPVQIARVFGETRQGLERHMFVAANFFMPRILNEYRNELEVAALPQELTAAVDATVAYLQARAARVSLSSPRVEAGRLETEVRVENLGGHKLPTAYPSRRAWLHLTVRGRDGNVAFESGAPRPDGSITGNDNDADPRRYEPHYSVIENSEQVQVYEDILGDSDGNVTTGLITAVRYLKDNRLLPQGFDKSTAARDIAVIGGAAEDSNFTDAGHRIRLQIAVDGTRGPFRVQAELCYQPVGYRWANNLKQYGAQAMEPRRFAGYFDAMAGAATVVLARAETKQ